MDEQPRKDFTFVGSFTPREIKRVTHYLEAEGVDYEIELDDSEIRNAPGIGVLSGMFPSPKAHLYVDPSKMLEVEAVMETLYPP